MNNLPMNKIEILFDGIRYLRVEERERTQDFYQEYDRIRTHLITLNQMTIEAGLVNAPEFNVFRLLGLSRAEVRTHSAMLAHLFRPNEIHGQQHLFLKSFLDYCQKKDPNFPLASGEIENAHWDILAEHVTASHGRMDIVIRSPDLGYIVVIENKVDAWEQTDQLERYGKWLESQRMYYPNQGLIYLTLLGSKAYTAKDVEYLALSYHGDIADWLAGVLNRIQAPNVSGVISQYIALARTL